jgi:hypothetical protein
MSTPAEALPLKKLGSGYFFSLIVILRSLITSKLRVVPYIKPYLLVLMAPCETMAIFACRKSWTINMTVL